MINQPMIAKSGGGSAGLHYTKVKSVASQDVYPQFVYQTPGGDYMAAEGKTELPETACRENGVFVIAAKRYSSASVTSDTKLIVKQTVENDTLILSGQTIRVANGTS